MNNETVTVAVDADTRDFDAAMRSLQNATKGFGQVFSSTISAAIQSGKGFEDTIKSIGKRLVDLALNQALKPLENLFGNLVGNTAGNLLNAATGTGGTVTGFAKGGMFQAGNASMFAKGGVVTNASAFSFGEKLGVMGEAGPEAIMPLGRGADGRLGVVASGEKPATNIVFNVQAHDATSFRKSEGQISAMLARAVARGKRGL